MKHYVGRWSDAAGAVACAEPEALRDAGLVDVASGSASWVEDPVVEGVVGLVKRGTNDALLLVYVAARDLEVSDELDAAVTS